MESKNSKTKVIIITCGGTIDKSYDEFDGQIKNRQSAIKEDIVQRLRLPYTEIEVISIMNKDSLRMNDYDRSLLAQSIKAQLTKSSPIVVIHGTDTMSKSAEYCYREMSAPNVPVVFTGAMRPLGFIDSDAAQNVTESLLAAKLLAPGFYISFHNRVFKVPKVKKDVLKGTFVETD